MLLNEETNTLRGVHQTPIIGQHARTDELNERLRSRQFPDTALEPQYSFRPASTKYNIFAISGKSTFAKPQKDHYVEHSVSNNFSPATQNAPWRGFANNVDKESELRNQFYALQRSSQAVYIPDKSSDLYRDGTTVVHRQVQQPYELLFAQPLFDPTQNKWKSQQNTKIGVDRFYNSTRTQMRQLS